MAGVESAVRIHIDRGDNLNARDETGQTPLMLSAARNKPAICKMLLAAGADAGLLDPLGRNALSIAEAAGATEAASAIEAVFERVGVATGKPAHTANHVSLLGFAEAELNKNTARVETTTPETTTTGIAVVVVDDGSDFDLSGWEAEEDQAPPEGDPALAIAAVGIQAAITEHHPIDMSADWDDFEAFLPDCATPLPRPDDAEARERLRLVLLRAVREGSVPRFAIEDLIGNNDRNPDAEASKFLTMVINDLGAESDERFEYSAPHESFEVFIAPDEEPSEEEPVADALAFLDNLAARRNEPLRLYQRDLRRQSLLTAEAEVALGQAMELGVEKALDALAAWPSGVAALLNAARQVAEGKRPLRSMYFASQADLLEAGAAPIADIDATVSLEAALELPDLEGEAAGPEDEPDLQSGLDTKESNDELAEFCAKAELLSELAVDERQNTPTWESCRRVLASLGLTRGFLMELANSDLADEADAALAFAQAMTAYRRARDQMVVANLKLVYSISKKYLSTGQPLDDLLQEGNIGLIKAVDRYDWRRGFKFSTYGTWWIRQHVGRFVADKGKTIRLPVHVYEKIRRIAQTAKDFELRHGRASTLEEISALVEMPVHKVDALVRMDLESLPLHELPDIDNLIAVHAQEQFAVRDAAEFVEDIQFRDSVDRFLSTLKLKEANVVRRRYGIGLLDSMTLEEVGACYGVTRERIRQIEAKALGRLRHPARLEQFLTELGLSLASEPEQRALTPGGSAEADHSKAPGP